MRLMPEYLVVCCWRSIKEVSLLLGEITANAPVAAEKETKGLISISQVWSTTATATATATTAYDNDNMTWVERTNIGTVKQWKQPHDSFRNNDTQL